MQCVLALVVLYVGLAHSFSWDFVTASRRHLKFYFNGSHTHSGNITSGRIEEITYDAVGNRLFYNTKNAIFSYDINQDIESLVLKSRKGAERNILGIAFDPVEELLFWREKSNKIYSFSLKPGFDNKRYGDLLTEISDKTISCIAVDSCRGYIYWTTIHLGDYSRSTIERARFDGSDKEVLISSNVRMPYSLVLDQQTQKLYWIDLFTRDQQFNIDSADLNGNNRTLIYSEKNAKRLPNTLAVSKDYIYWIDGFSITVKQLSKNPSMYAEPKEITIKPFNDIMIATNYEIDDQTRGIQECEELKRLVANNSVTDNNVSVNISSDVSLLCVHGKKVSGKSQCQCTHGYTGERCDVSVCQNYCFQGDCIVSDEEQPTCRCNAGYSGERCQVNDCLVLFERRYLFLEREESASMSMQRTLRRRKMRCFNLQMFPESSFNGVGHHKSRCNTSYSGQRGDVNVCVNITV